MLLPESFCSRNWSRLVMVERSQGPQHFQPTAWLPRVAFWGLGQLGPGKGWLWHCLGIIIFGHHNSILLAYGSYRLLAHTLCSTPNGHREGPSFLMYIASTVCHFRSPKGKQHETSWPWTVGWQEAQVLRLGREPGSHFAWPLTLAENMERLSGMELWSQGSQAVSNDIDIHLFWHVSGMIWV